MRPLILAAAIVIAVLTAVWFSQPRLKDSLETPPEPITSEVTTSEITTSEIPKAEPTLSVQTQPVNATHEDHDHKKNHEHDGELTPELEAYIESQRIPADQIPITVHGDGKATVHTGKQWSTVMMMVIDDDGTRRMVERQITPEGQLVIPEQ